MDKKSTRKDWGSKRDCDLSQNRQMVLTLKALLGTSRGLRQDLTEFASTLSEKRSQRLETLQPPFVVPKFNIQTLAGIEIGRSRKKRAGQSRNWPKSIARQLFPTGCCKPRFPQMRSHYGSSHFCSRLKVHCSHVSRVFVCVCFASS